MIKHAHLGAVFILSAFMFINAPINAYAEADSVVVVTMTDTINVRTGPDIETDLLGPVEEGTQVEVLDWKDGWLYVDCDGKRGYVQAFHTTFYSSMEMEVFEKDEADGEIEEDAPFYKESYTTMVTVTDTVNMRKGRSTDTTRLGQIDQGFVVEVLGPEKDGWLNVRSGDETGYILSKYAEVFSQSKAENKEMPRVWQQAVKTSNNVSVQSTEDERLLLAALIYCEAGNQPYEGQVAVGEVVMNRVRSGLFPNTISEVIRQKGQFTPVKRGKVDRMMQSGKIFGSCYQAADEALAGNTSYIGDCLYFHRYDGCNGIIIGDHVFK